MSDFKNAIDLSIEGATKVLTDGEMFEYRYLSRIVSKLFRVANTVKHPVYYINLLPLEVVRSLLVGEYFYNAQHVKCRIDQIELATYDGATYVATVSTDSGRYRTRSWRMSLNTIVRECSLVNDSLETKYMIMLNPQDVKKKAVELNKKLTIYNNKVKQAEEEAQAAIKAEVHQHENEAQVTREAIRRVKRELWADATQVRSAWETALSTEEQKELVDWIAKNVFSMRLWVLKDGAYDKAITQLFPDEQYGTKRRGEASESSKDAIGGYISFKDISDAPMDIIKKLTDKVDPNAAFRKNVKGNTYRLNNYKLVLYLLQNYNSRGFKTGVTNLNQQIQ